MPGIHKVQEREPDGAVAVTERRSGGVLRLGDPLEVLSRVAIWGTFAGVASALVGPLIGGSVVTWFLGGAGAIVGGLGTVGLSALILKRRAVRVTWKVAAMLGVPFGLYLGALGVFQLFVLPSIVGGTRGLSLSLILPVFGTVIVVGIVLSLLLGIDIVRFVVQRVNLGEDEDEM